MQNILLDSAVLLLLAGGGSVVLISGHFDLSSEGTLEFTGVLGAWLVVKGSPAGPFGLSPFLVIPMMLAIGALVGVFNGLLVTKFGVNPFMATLTVMLILKGAAIIPGYASTIDGLPNTYEWISNTTFAGVSVAVYLSILIYVVLAFYIRYSRFGRHLYAVGGNRASAIANGISVTRVVVWSYVISGVLGAVAGWIDVARVDSASFSLDNGIIFMVFASMVIGGLALAGGRGSLLGAAAGALILGCINAALNLSNFNPLYDELVDGVALLVAVGVMVARQRLATRFKLQEKAW